MRSFLLPLQLIALAIPPLFGCAEQPESRLKEFTSVEGGFSVLLPEVPTESTSRPLKDPTGVVVSKNHLFTVDQGDSGAYIVSYMEHSVLENFQRADKEEFEKALDKLQEGVQASVKGKLLKATAITLEEKYPGRAFNLELPGPGIYRCRVYLMNDRFYQLVAVGKKEFATTKTADEFLDSFKLLK